MQISRRTFFKRTGALAAGAAALVVVGSQPSAKSAAPNPHALVASNHDSEPDYGVYDILVSECWADECAAGRGTEGQPFANLYGEKFRVFSKITPAVNAANSGDRILVTAGTYHGPIPFRPDIEFTMKGSTIV